MSTISQIEQKLDDLYCTSKYEEYLQTVKKLYRVFRNSNGKHKLKPNDNYLNEAFGGVFKDIFGGKA